MLKCWRGPLSSVGSGRTVFTKVYLRMKIFFNPQTLRKLFISIHVFLINISLATYWIHSMLTLFMTSQNMNLAFRLCCVGSEIYARIYEWKWIGDVIKCAKYSENHWTPNGLRVSTNVIHDVVEHGSTARGWRATNQSSLHPTLVVIHRMFWKCEQHKHMIQFYELCGGECWWRHSFSNEYFVLKVFKI